MVTQIEQIPVLTGKEKVERNFLLYICIRIYLFSCAGGFRIKMLLWKGGLRFCLKCCEFAKSKAEKFNRD